MRRREFIKAAAGSAAVWPLAARAQQGDRVRRLAVLMSVEESDPEAKAQLSGFTQALAQLGWTEGRNLQIDVRWGGSSDVDRARSLAKELVALKPDVILSQGTPVTAVFKRETQTIPIVFVVVTDPVGDGFVAGLPHPGGNITGFLTSESGITAKMLELLSEIAPGLKRIAILFNPDTAPGGGALRFRGRCTILEARAGYSERCRNRKRRHGAWRKSQRRGSWLCRTSFYAFMSSRSYCWQRETRYQPSILGDLLLVGMMVCCHTDPTSRI